MNALTGSQRVAASAGLLLVSGDGVRLAEWRPGRAEDVLRLEFPPLEQRELRGPAHAHPRTAAAAAPGTHSGGQHDLYEKRVEVHRQRFVREVADEVTGIAEQRGWKAVVVFGDPRLSHVATQVLRHGPAPVVESDAILGWLPPNELAERAAPLVEAVLDEHDVRSRPRHRRHG